MSHDVGVAVGRAGRGFLEERAREDVRVAGGHLQLRCERAADLDVELLTDVAVGGAGGDPAPRRALPTL